MTRAGLITGVILTTLLAALPARAAQGEDEEPSVDARCPDAESPDDCSMWICTVSGRRFEVRTGGAVSCGSHCMTTTTIEVRPHGFAGGSFSVSIEQPDGEGPSGMSLECANGVLHVWEGETGGAVDLIYDPKTRYFDLSPRDREEIQSLWTRGAGALATMQLADRYAAVLSKLPTEPDAPLHMNHAVEAWQRVSMVQAREWLSKERRWEARKALDGRALWRPPTNKVLRREFEALKAELEKKERETRPINVVQTIRVPVPKGTWTEHRLPPDPGASIFWRGDELCFRFVSPNDGMRCFSVTTGKWGEPVPAVTPTPLTQTKEPDCETDPRCGCFSEAGMGGLLVPALAHEPEPTLPLLLRDQAACGFLDRTKLIAVAEGPVALLKKDEESFWLVDRTGWHEAEPEQASKALESSAGSNLIAGAQLRIGRKDFQVIVEDLSDHPDPWLLPSVNVMTPEQLLASPDQRWVAVVGFGDAGEWQVLQLLRVEARAPTP